MKPRLPILISVLVASLQSIGQQKPPALAISHLTGDFYVYTTYNEYKGTPFPANSMYMVTTNGVVMLDVPWDTTQFQPLLDSIQERHYKKVVLCIASHFHSDRTAAFDFLKTKGIATWSSAQTLQLCKEKGEKQAAFVFTKDTTFTVGNHSFEVFYPGAGHTRDNIVFWFAKEKILYGGCFIKSTEAASLGNLDDADPGAWAHSIKKVQQRFPQHQYIVTGHQSWQSNQSLRYTLQLIQKYLAGKAK